VTPAAPGILAIWHDCRAGREAEFEQWFQGEHLAERLSVPGFLFGRRHEAISGSSAFFNFYVTETPAVLTSKPYLDRLNDPTPMTRRIMSEVFMNMCRTVCGRSARLTTMRGAFAVTARFNEAPDQATLATCLRSFTNDPAIANGEIWIAADQPEVPMANEEKLRGGDRKIRTCLMIDTLRQSDAERLSAVLAGQFPTAEVGVFRVLCQLGRGDI
jgi:hypothetical protein